MGWSLKRAVFGPPKPPREVLKNELFAGVPKPSSLLMGMIIAKMQESLVKASVKGVSYPLTGIQSNRTPFQWEDDKIKVSWKYYNTGSYETRYVFEDIVIKLGDKLVELNAQETEQFKIAAKKMMQMKTEFEKHRAENKRQLAATDLIEEFFKPKPLPVPEVVKEDAAPFVPSAESLSKRVTIVTAPKRRRSTVIEEVNELSAMVD